MKTRALHAALLVLTIASLAWAANVTFNITSAAQDTAIRAELLPLANKALCAQFGLPANCSAAQLSAEGCVAKAFTTVTKRDLVYQNCTPFTLDSNGQAAHAGDTMAREYIRLFASSKTNDVTAACTNFKALGASAQNAICASLGAPVPSTVCDICQ
jgi:hypothetical protein